MRSDSQRTGFVAAAMATATVVMMATGGCTSTTGPSGSATGSTAANGVAVADAAGDPVEVVAVAGRPPAGTVPADLRERCIDASVTLDRRVEDEDVEFPDDPDELSDDELDEMMLPAVDVPDDVVSPDHRPTIEPMPSFDIDTSPILDVDEFVGMCFDVGIITDADVWDDDDREWCDDLADASDDEIAEFVESDGAEVVADEFEFCGIDRPALDL